MGSIPTPGTPHAAISCVSAPDPVGRVVRADTPPRHDGETAEREVLWLLSRDAALPVRADLVGLTDAVELEVFNGGRLRRRYRFLRDIAARRYADRFKARLIARGFRDRRGESRTASWPGD